MAELTNIVPNMNLVYPEHNDLFAENVLKCFVEQELLDLVFLCDKNIEVFAHKLVFASVSQFISNLINVHGQDVVYISVPDIDHHKLRILVNFLYEGVTKVNFEEMMILKEVMSLLGIELQNAEIRTVNSLANVTSVMLMKDIKKEADPLIEEDPIQEHSQAPCDPPDLVPFVGDVRTLSINATREGELDKEDEENKEKNVEDMMDVDIEMDNRGNEDILNVEDGEVVDLENEETGQEFIDLSSDEDPDIYVEKVENDCEVIMETVRRRRQVFKHRHKTTYAESLDATNSISADAGFKVTGNAVDGITIASGDASAYITVHQISSQNSESPFVTKVEDYQITPDIDIPVDDISKYDQKDALQSMETSDSAQCRQSKRKGFRLSLEKREILEEEYKKKRPFTKKRMSELAKKLKIRRDTVSLWYKHKQAVSKTNMENNKKTLRLTDDQEEVLESVYIKNKFITNEQQVALAKQLELPPETVCIWFSKRQKNKSSDFENDSQCLQGEEEYGDKQKKGFEKVCARNLFPVKEKKSEQDFKNASSPKRKKHRFRFTREQRQFLENEYMKNNSVSKKQQLLLAEQLGAPSRTVLTWFQGRRRSDFSGKSTVKYENPMKHSHFSQDQKDILESHYINGTYEDKEMLMKLSQQLGVRSIKLKYWFYNRQLKDKCETLSLSDDVSKNLDQLTEDQKMILDSAYEERKFLSEKDQDSLAEHMSIPNSIVRNFFVSKWIENEAEAERQRIRLTVDQKKVLLATYENDKYPSTETEKNLAQQLGVLHSSVNHWFFTKRKDDEMAGLEPVKYQAFNEEQKSILEKSYRNNRLMSKEEKEKLAQELKCPVRKVQIWFYNRKTKDKKRACVGLKQRNSKDKRDSLEEMSEDTRESNLSSKSIPEIDRNISTVKAEVLTDFPDIEKDEEGGLFPICHVDVPAINYDQTFEVVNTGVTVKQEIVEDLPDTNSAASQTEGNERIGGNEEIPGNEEIQGNEEVQRNEEMEGVERNEEKERNEETQ